MNSHTNPTNRFGMNLVRIVNQIDNVQRVQGAPGFHLGWVGCGRNAAVFAWLCERAQRPHYCARKCVGRAARRAPGTRYFTAQSGTRLCNISRRYCGSLFCDAAVERGALSRLSVRPVAERKAA